ncbi:MAG: lysophospholipid acyltransferase family protein, partial [Myxococcota bacterium]
MFLYRTLRHALKLGLELYYVDIQAVGQERVPESGPVMFAANHPNSIMDTVVLGAQTNRSISYLARSGLFKNPLMALLFRQCGVIPVYRAQDGPIAKGSNESAFRAAFDVLRKGGTIGIFPEGQNAPERQVRDIKTGTARIALGAEAEEDFGLGVKIVPVGLNFTDRDRYLTRVLVRFGEPIDARDFASAYRADERSAVRELTDAIQQGIREQAVHITDGRHTQLVSDVNAVYGRKLLDELRGRLPDVRRLDQKLYDSMRAVRSGQDLDGYFEAKQRIADAAAHFQKADPEALYRISRRLRRYKDHLAQANLRADFVDRPPKTLRVRSEAIKMSLYAIVLAPIALYGALHNYIPARLTRRAILRA